MKNPITKNKKQTKQKQIVIFPAPPILNIFWRKFHGLVLGLVELIDVKDIDVAQPIWSWGCPPKNTKNTKNAFFACFGAYVWQPHDPIGWATPMPFASTNSTNPRTNPWNWIFSHQKIWNYDFNLKININIFYFRCVNHFACSSCDQKMTVKTKFYEVDLKPVCKVSLIIFFSTKRSL